MSTVYKIYTKVNYADTMRDPDDIHYETIAHKAALSDAVACANDYIKKYFLNKKTKLSSGEGKITYSATDFCSYGKTILIEEIKVE